MKFKNTIKLLVVIVVMTSSYQKAVAGHPTPPGTISSIENPDNNWVMVQNENGITISFLKFIKNDKTYLKIKFENTNSESMTFDWSLNKGSLLIFDNPTATELISAGNQSNEVAINVEDAMSDFSVIINFK